MESMSIDNILQKSAENEAKSLELVSVKKQIDLSLDLAHLAAFDTNPIDIQLFCKDREEYLKNLSRDNAQLVMNEIWNLETKRNDNVIVALLPKAVFNLPREKPVPKQKAPTKWQLYASAKGIQKRKKEKLVWDDNAKDWRPRYGYKGINQNKDQWVIEVPNNADPNTDFFERQVSEKKERVAKNELQRLRNIARNKNLKLAGTAGIVPNIDLSKDQLNKAQSLAKQSTASLGKFVDKLSEEKPEKNSGKKRKFESNLDDLKGEKSKNLQIIDHLLERQKKSIDDSVEESALRSVKKLKKGQKARSNDDDDNEEIGAKYNKRKIVKSKSKSKPDRKKGRVGGKFGNRKFKSKSK